jgi:RNA polymerase sigma-70 factor (ECF subfamily)
MTTALAFASEPDLLGAAAAGNAGAVRRLLDDAGPVVYGFVLARVAGDTAKAEDLVQETFLQAVRSAGSFRGEAALTTWLCGIARHLLARHYADERRQERARSGLVALDGGAGGHEADPAATLDAVEHRQQLLDALGRLPVLHRQVLVLKYLDGRSVEEIAAEVGRTRVQVQSLLQRARDGLRRELGERDV